MLIAQDHIGQNDGDVCGMYWSEYDPGYPNSDNKPDIYTVWKNASRGERVGHLFRYLSLEDTYYDDEIPFEKETYEDWLSYNKEYHDYIKE